MVTALLILTVHVRVTSLVTHFLLYVNLVETNNSLLEFLVVRGMVQALIDIVLELLLVGFLFVKFCAEVLHFVSQTFLSHSEIINDQGQVLIYPVEVFQLLTHFVGLLIQSLNFRFSWTNVSLKLLDLVIKYEFELLKLLGLLFQIDDTLVLVFDSLVSFLELVFLTLDRRFQLIDGLQ